MDWFLYDTASVMKKLKLKLFSYKNVSQIASKIFATHCSFTDHLKHNIVNETICKNALSKFWATVSTSVRELFIC